MGQSSGVTAMRCRAMVHPWEPSMNWGWGWGSRSWNGGNYGGRLGRFFRSLGFRYSRYCFR